MSIDYRLLGKNIQIQRKAKKITQEQLAEALDMSVSFVSQVERGVAKTSLDSLADICDVLGCSPGNILDHSKEENDPLLSQFMQLYYDLSYQDKIRFLHMLEAYHDYR